MSTKCKTVYSAPILRPDEPQGTLCWLCNTARQIYITDRPFVRGLRDAWLVGVGGMRIELLARERFVSKRRRRVIEKLMFPVSEKFSPSFPPVVKWKSNATLALTLLADQAERLLLEARKPYEARRAVDVQLEVAHYVCP